MLRENLSSGLVDPNRSAQSSTEASQRLEISDIETRSIILSMQRTTKALIRLHGCTGCSAPLLFAYGINRFSHDVAHMVPSSCLTKTVTLIEKKLLGLFPLDRNIRTLPSTHY